jgi:hypothetical protein
MTGAYGKPGFKLQDPLRIQHDLCRAAATSYPWLSAASFGGRATMGSAI